MNDLDNVTTNDYNSLGKKLKYLGTATILTVAVQNNLPLSENHVSFNNISEIQSSDASNSIIDQMKVWLEDLKNLDIVIIDKIGVGEYLANFPTLASVLKQLGQEARDNFKDSQLSLQIYSDPEEDNQYLSLYVRQESYGKDIMKKIRTIRAKYYDQMSSAFPGWILLTTDFQLP